MTQGRKNPKNQRHHEEINQKITNITKSSENDAELRSTIVII